MVAKEILDKRYDDPDCTRLPFFALTRSASQFFYFCRQFSLLEGGDVVVLTKSECGTCAARVYFTGGIFLENEEIGLGDYPFTTDFAAKFGFSPHLKACELGELTRQRILEVMDREMEDAWQSRGITRETFDRALAARVPLIDAEFPIEPSILEGLVDVTIQSRLPEKDEVFAQVYYRVIAFDGSRRSDYTSEVPVPTWKKILKGVDKVAKLARRTGASADTGSLSFAKRCLRWIQLRWW